MFCMFYFGYFRWKCQFVLCFFILDGHRSLFMPLNSIYMLMTPTFPSELQTLISNWEYSWLAPPAHHIQNATLDLPLLPLRNISLPRENSPDVQAKSLRVILFLSSPHFLKQDLSNSFWLDIQNVSLIWDPFIPHPHKPPSLSIWIFSSLLTPN